MAGVKSLTLEKRFSFLFSLSFQKENRRLSLRWKFFLCVYCVKKNIYADAGPKYIKAGRLLFTRKETGIEVTQQSWNKLATRVAI